VPEGSRASCSSRAVVEDVRRISTSFVTVQVTMVSGSPQWIHSSWSGPHRESCRAASLDLGSPVHSGSAPCFTSVISTWASSWSALEVCTEFVFPLERSDGAGEGRGLGGTTAIPGTHAQVSFSPRAVRHLSQCLFGREGGSWYSSLGDVKPDTDSVSGYPLLDGEEPDELDKAASLVER